MTKLEQLAKTAKDAQRAYDTAKNKPENALEEGEIQVYSDNQGFSWNCNAGSHSIVRHTAKTIASAFGALNNIEDKAESALAKLMLAIEIMAELEIVKDQEK